MYTRILVAVDGSGPSTRAFREAVRLAADQHALLRISHVVDLGVALAPWAEPAFIDYTTLDSALHEAGKRIVDDALTEARPGFRS